MSERGSDEPVPESLDEDLELALDNGMKDRANVCHNLYCAIRKAVEGSPDPVTYTEIIGALECVKLDIWELAQNRPTVDGDDDESERWKQGSP